jgi:hypothetical protein
MSYNLTLSRVHLGETPSLSILPTATRRRPDWLRPRNQPTPSTQPLYPPKINLNASHHFVFI